MAMTNKGNNNLRSFCISFMFMLPAKYYQFSCEITLLYESGSCIKPGQELDRKQNANIYRHA